jgi:hypothetical protein
MNMAQKNSLLFYMLANVSAIVFGMDILPSSSIKPAHFYLQSSHNPEEFFCDKTKMTLLPHQKRGLCAVQLVDQDKAWFFQEIHGKMFTIASRQIRIENPKANVQIFLVNGPKQKRKMIVGLNDAYYLFVHDKIIFLKEIIPYTHIKTNIEFYKKDTEGDSYKLLLPKDKISTTTNTAQITEDQCCNIIGITGNNILIGVRENPTQTDYTKMLSLPVSLTYYASVEKKSDLLLVYTPQEENSRQVALVVKNEKPEVKEVDKIKQCSLMGDYTPKQRSSLKQNSVVYLAHGCKCSKKTNIQEEYEVRFTVGDTEFIRIFQCWNLQQKMLSHYVEIADILPHNIYVCFFNHDYYKGEKNNLTIPPHTNPRANTQQESSAGRSITITGQVVAYIVSDETSIFLPTYKGTITKHKGPDKSSEVMSAQLILDISPDHPIEIMLVAEEITNLEGKQLLVLQNRGKDLCAVECIFTKKEQPPVQDPTSTRTKSGSKLDIQRKFTLISNFLLTYHKQCLLAVGGISVFGCLFFYYFRVIEDKF